MTVRGAVPAPNALHAANTFRAVLRSLMIVVRNGHAGQGAFSGLTSCRLDDDEGRRIKLSSMLAKLTVFDPNFWPSRMDYDHGEHQGSSKTV